MSSVPLISHHLFVAAVKEKVGAGRVSHSAEAVAPAVGVRVRVLPFELIDFGRPLSAESSLAYDAGRRPGPT
jgi:hypothetical protein